MKKCKFLLQPLATFQRLSLSPSLDRAALPASLLGCTPHQEQPRDGDIPNASSPVTIICGAACTQD